MFRFAVDHFPADLDDAIVERSERDYIARLRGALAELAADPLSITAADAVRELL